MYTQLTPDEYDLAIMEAERDLAISGVEIDEETVPNREFTTRAYFFIDLRKVSKRNGGPKPSPARSKT